MNNLDRKVSHPFVAVFIYLGIGFLLNEYGIRDGSLLLFCFLAGVLIYKIVTRY